MTSQFWANVYLHPLDMFIKQQLGCRAYLRYADDLLLFADDKPTLHAWREESMAFAASLRLTFHQQRAQVVPVTAGFPFVGWVVTPACRRLRRRNVIAFWRRYRQRLADYGRGAITLDQIGATVHGWVGQIKHGSTTGLRKAVLRLPIPRKTRI